MTQVPRKTPLYDAHIACGGKMVEFAGWELPVRYTDVAEEHRAVRTAAGLFDVSHMGEFIVSGKEAEAALNYMTCNAVHKLVDGKAQYTAITNSEGGIVDDIIIYRMAEERYFLCVNAANTAKDLKWLKEHNQFNATIEDVSSDYAQLALQGPEAQNILAKVVSGQEAPNLPYFAFTTTVIQGAEVIVARTGYTGEDGFEIFMPPAAAPAIWNRLLEVGKDHGLVPAGLGARDSLRLEVCYPLHGHELKDSVSVLESDLGWIVKLDKGDFIGREVLVDQKNNGIPRKLVGFKVEDRGIVREEAVVESHDGTPIGVVTSGTRTPTVDHAIGLALVDSAYADTGTKWTAVVRSRRLRCSVVKKPFYQRQK